jgi:glycosyltransferase involved in cell wall biosynthesis
LRDADVAHIFSASYSSFVVAVFPAWLIATMRGKKTLINYHSGEARGHLAGSWFARAVLKRAGGVVTPSAYLVDVFREFGLQAAPVPNIVDLSQFTYRLREPLRPHLVCTRGFHPYYCVDGVVKAFAQVKREFPEAQLDLVGGGLLEDDIRQLVSELKIEGVNFCGIASREEIGKYYDRADIFINGSRLDNMPVSVLEAFASGTPIISTAPEGMRYLVEHGRTGLLSEPGDPEALAQNVIRVLRDPQLACRLSSNALQEVKRYDWVKVRNQWLDVYRALLPTKLPAATKNVAQT